jgi:acyl carrier protein
VTAAIAPQVSADEFLQLVAKYLKALGDPAALTPQSNLFDLGLDSTAALSLLMEIEERYGVTFPDSLLSDSTFETAEALKRGLDTLLATRV